MTKMPIKLLLISLLIGSLASAFLQVESLERHRSSLAALDPESSTSSSKRLANPPFRLQHIDHVVIRCEKFEPMFDFYHRILGCTIDEPTSEYLNRFGGALTHLRAGSCYIDLLAYDSNHLSHEGTEAVANMHGGGKGIFSLNDAQFSPNTSTLDHLCLRVEPFDEQQIMGYLEQENVQIVVTGGDRLGADGVGRSIYVCDPEGNVIELKGPPQKSHPIQSSVAVGAKKSNTLDTHQNFNPQSSNNGDTDDANTVAIPNCDSASAKSTEHSDEDVSATPCIRICRYNSSFYDGQVCIGCFRDAYEVGAWQSMTAIEKSMTILDAIDRCKESEGNFDGSISRDELTRQQKYWESMAKSNGNN
jgi:glyoxylase I family protein